MSDTERAGKQIKEMNRYYEARAPWHDDFMSYESNAQHEERLKPIIESIEPLLAGKKVVEIACGTGNWTEVLAQRAGSVIATDQSQASLEIARTKLADSGNVTLMTADAYNLRAVSESFDVLLAADWFSHIPKQALPLFLESIRHVLAPGSVAIFIDMLTNAYFREERCEHDEYDNRVSIRSLPNGSEYRVIKNFPTESELRGLLEPFGHVTYVEHGDLERWMVMLNWDRLPSK